MKFVFVQRFFTLVFIAALIVLFILPSSLIHSTYEQVILDIDRAQSSLEQEDYDAALTSIGAIYELLNSRARRIKWFVNHGVVNEALLEAELAYKMCVQQDKEASLAALIALKSALNALDDIEHFDVNTFL
ncbi:MAG: DUF4363 family protein [Clostridia bacterium]|nr:DUF4363 family protein [Clostridia bacterium]